MSEWWMNDLEGGEVTTKTPTPNNDWWSGDAAAGETPSSKSPVQATYEPDTSSDNKGLFQTVSNAVTGKGSIEYDDLPELSELDLEIEGVGDFLSKSGTLLKTMLTTDPEEKGRILRSALPETFTDLRADKYGNPIIKKGDQWAYINKSGVSVQDGIDLAAQAVQFLPAARVAGKAATTAGRIAKGAAASGATDIAQQAGVIASDGKDGIDLGQTLITTAAGGVAEGILPPIAKKTGELAKRFFKKGDEATAHTAKETGNAGLEQVSDAAEDSVSFEIPLTVGQRTRDIARMQKEEALRQGAQGDAAQRIMREFDDKQMAAITKGADDLQKTIGHGSGFDPELAPNVSIGSKLQENLINAEKAAKQQVREAYKTAYEGRSMLSREGVEEFSKGLKRKLLSEGHSLDAKHNGELRRLMGLIDSRLANPNVKKVSLTSVENWRKQLNSAITKHATDPQDAALISTKHQLDDFLDEAVTRGLVDGDETVLRQLKRARSLRTEYGRIFAKSYKDPSGRMMMNVLNAEKVAPEKVINTIYGANIITNPAVSRGMVRRIKKVFGPDSEEVKMLKDAFLLKAFTDKSGNLSKSMIAGKAKRFIKNDAATLTDELFTPGERRTILRYAHLVEQTLQHSDAINPSKSGWAVLRGLFDAGLLGAGRSATSKVGETTLGQIVGRVATEVPVIGPAFREGVGARAAKSAISQKPKMFEKYVNRLQSNPWIEAGAIAAERIAPEGAKPHQLAYSAMVMSEEDQNTLQAIQDERTDLFKDGDYGRAINHRFEDEFNITGPDMMGGGIIKRVGKAARMRHITPEANLKKGKVAAKQALNNKKDVMDAMYRDDLGSISFYYGNDAVGLKHIQTGRTLKDAINGEVFVTERVPEILAFGKLQRVYGPPNGRRADITYKDGRVSLSLYRFKDRETWVITAFEDW